ncbi:hypothetical protein [Aquisalimonas sp.]|nr:hypothetical protein [Aquisalimonas sp.]
MCEVLPLGTRFMWHALNALNVVVLGWMIEMYRNRMVAAPSACAPA